MWIRRCTYPTRLPFFNPTSYQLADDTPVKNSEELREQHELTQEIGNAITSMPITEPVDEDELEADLAELEQEKLNEKMLGTTVPVGDSVSRLPSVANGEGEFRLLAFCVCFFMSRKLDWAPKDVSVSFYAGDGFYCHGVSPSPLPPNLGLGYRADCDLFSSLIIVGKSKAQAEEEDEEEELRKLEAEMAL